MYTVKKKNHQRLKKGHPQKRQNISNFFKKRYNSTNEKVN